MSEQVAILVGTIDFRRLRDFQLKEYNLQKMNKEYKPTPPVFDKKIEKEIVLSGGGQGG